MFDHRHYVPIVKGRRGEYRALREMKDPKSGITPMIDVPPMNWDFENDETSKTIDEHLRAVPENIKKCWGPGHPIFIDLYMIPELEVMGDGRHPLVYLFDRMREESDSAGLFPDVIRGVPVTGLNRPPTYQTAVAQTVAHDRRGICLRIENRDFEDDENLEGEIRTLLSELQVPPSETDLVLDLKEVSPSSRVPLTHAARSMIQRLPSLNKWRTFTLAASAFPANLMDLQPGNINILPRTEWMMWENLAIGKSKLTRLPTFGDYGIRHPHFPEAQVDPRQLRSAPNLRYTVARDWLVLKGRDAKKHGLGQFNGLCEILVD
jgi:hypothetical protein